MSGTHKTASLSCLCKYNKYCGDKAQFDGRISDNEPITAPT